jgi:predicted transcriptional regulator
MHNTHGEKTMEDKKTRSFRLTDEADKLLQAIADKYGISKTAALEIVIRNQAKAEKVA